MPRRRLGWLVGCLILAATGPGRGAEVVVSYTVVEKGEFVPLKDWSRWKP